MANENEPAKELLPYLQRADELQIHQPLVSYYCRLYAMQRGIKIPKSQRTNTTNALLVSLIKLLEKDKKSMKLGPDDNLHLEGFAMSVFAKADRQDRAGRADMSTAKTFYASSIFFEILNQFGELQPDLEEKQKYAAWKAADIRKALKEGRKPVPGPSTVEKEQNISRKVEQNDRGTIRTDLDMGPAPGFDGSPELFNEVDHRDFSNNLRSRNPTNKYPSHNYDQSPSHYDSSHSATSVPNTKNGQADSSGRNGIAIETSTTSSQAFELYDSNYQPPSEKITEAHKAARFALGALSFDDVSIAVDYLKRSLELLTNPSAALQ